MIIPEVRDELCGEDLPVDREREHSQSPKSQKDIIVSRPIFSQERFDNLQEKGAHLTPVAPWKKFKRNTCRRIREARQWHPSLCSLCIGFVKSTFPILKWLPQYDVRKFLVTDLLSGFLVAIMSIPSGMAYSLLASIPAVYGLYTSFFPSLIYAVMASSKHVSIGVFAIISIMTGKLVQQYALPNSAVALLSTDNFTGPGLGSVTSNLDNDFHSHLESRIRVVVCVTVAAGIWQLLMGLLGLGYLTVYLSDQLVTGFTTGTAIHVFTSQLKPIFGLQKMKDFNGPFKIIYTWIDFFTVIGSTHFTTVIISAITVNFLLCIKYFINDNKWTQKRFPFRVVVPGELFVVIFGALISYYMQLGPKYGVDIVGYLPLGLPAPQLPDFSILPAFAVDTFAIAIVSFAISLSLAKMYSIKHKYYMNSNQELRALGCSNIFAGFFQCLPSTGFLGRVTAQSSIGGESQVVSLLSAGIILIVLLFLGHLLEPLPKSCLGCIIVVALINMLKQVAQVHKLGKVSAVDASVFLVAILAVVILDVDIGLGVAVGWSLLTIVFRTQRPAVAVLGRAHHTDIYRRVDDYKSVTEVPGCKIISFSAPLYFANADYFLQRVRSLAKLNRPHVHKAKAPKRVKKGGDSSGHAPAASEQHTPEDGLGIPMVDLNNELSNGKHGSTHNDVSTWTADYFDQPIKHLIIDCSGMCFLDINGAQAIKDLAAQCGAVGTTLFITSCKSEMKEMLALSGFSKYINAEHIFMHVHDAVMQAVREHEGEKTAIATSDLDSPLGHLHNGEIVLELSPDIGTRPPTGNPSFGTQTLAVRESQRSAG